MFNWKTRKANSVTIKITYKVAVSKTILATVVNGKRNKFCPICKVAFEK